MALLPGLGFLGGNGGSKVNLDSDIYGTGTQQEFAREMAKKLLGREMPPIRHWTQGVAEMLNALAGAQYRDLAGHQEMRGNQLAAPGTPPPETPVTYGTKVNNPAPAAAPQNIPGVVVNPPDPNNNQAPMKLGANPADVAPPTGDTPPVAPMSNVEKLFAEYVKKGNTPEQAAAIVGNQMQESGPKIDPTATSVNDNPRMWNFPHSIGVSQWNGKRAADLFKFASDKGIDLGDWKEKYNKGTFRDPKVVRETVSKIPLEVQAAFTMHEMENGEKGVKGAKDLKSAVAGMISNLRPLGSNISPEAAHGYSSRLGNAQSVYNQFKDKKYDAPVATAALPEVPGLMAEAKMTAGAPDAGAMKLGGPIPPEALKDEAIEQNRATVAGQGIPDPAALGGPSAPIKVADSGQSYGGQAAQPGATHMIDIPGYKGPAPFVGPVLTRDELVRQLNTQSSPEGKARMLENYQKSLQPQNVPVPNGVLTILPQSGGRAVYHFQPGNETLTAQPGAISMKPKAEGGYAPAIPGGVDGPGAGALWEQLSRDKANAEGVGTLVGKNTELVNRAKEEGNNALTKIQHLAGMGAISQTSDFTRGPLKDRAETIRGFMDNFGWLPRSESAKLDDKQIIDKFNNRIASEAASEISNRGSNFQLETELRTFPGGATSAGAFKSLIDIMTQAEKQKFEISKLAHGSKSGADIESFQKRKQEYLDSHPIIITRPNGDKVTTKTINSEKDLEDVPSGMRFMYNGKMGIKP